MAGESPDRGTDPRVNRTRRAVMDAVARLIVNEGSGSVTHQRVAEVAGVGRATLYRHWPAAADMLYDALAEHEQPLLRPYDRPLVEWLRAELRYAARELGQPTAVQFVAVMMGRADHDASAADLRRRLNDQNVMNLAVAVARAHARGEIVGEPNPRELYAMLVGPLLLHVMVERRPVSEAFIDNIVDVVMAPWVAGSGHAEATLRHIGR